MKNLYYINNLDWWVLLIPHPKIASRFTYEVYKTRTSCFPLLKGIKTKNSPIRVQQVSAGISKKKIQLLDNELNKLIKDLLA